MSSSVTAAPAANRAVKSVKTLVIVGCGLLGTSVAKAFRNVMPGARMLGVDSGEVARAEASELSAYDQVGADVGSLELNDDDGPVIGVVATPPAFIASTVRDLAPLCALVMDVGSIKAPVVDALQADGGMPANFVPCHPMAGSHRQGPASGIAELFDGRWVFVVSGADFKSAPRFQEQVATQGDDASQGSGWKPDPTGLDVSPSDVAHAFWQALGARTQDIDAVAHDRAVAYTSHLPHLLASAYMAVETPDVAAAGTGYMEFTRLAKSNPEMWSQVLQSNQAAWRPLLASYISTLKSLDALIENGTTEEIMSYLSDRREERFALDIPADEARSLV